MDTSCGGEPRDECKGAGERGVGGVSGDDGGVFNSGEFNGVSGDGEREVGSGISDGAWGMSTDEVDKEADSRSSDAETARELQVTRLVVHERADSMSCGAEAIDRSLVTCQVVHADTGSLEEAEGWWLASSVPGI